MDIGITTFDIQIPSGRKLIENHKKIFIETGSLFDLVKSAGINVLKKSTVSPNEIDLIIFAGSGSSQKWLWSPSAKLQFDLDLNNAQAFDVFNGCNSLQISIQIAKQFLLANRNKNHVLILIGDELSKIGDINNQEHEPLWSFGDSAAAILVQKNASTLKVVSQSFFTDGSFYDDLWFDPKRETTFLDNDQIRNKNLSLAYEKNYPKQILAAMNDAGIQKKDLATVCMNQGSPKIIDKTEDALGLKRGTILRTFNEYGHLGSADVLLALKYFLTTPYPKNRLQNKYIALASSSVGYSWGCTILKL